jgi:hypothetical protein
VLSFLSDMRYSISRQFHSPPAFVLLFRQCFIFLSGLPSKIVTDNILHIHSRRAARTAHPDKGVSEAKMAAVNEAYEVLSTPGPLSPFLPLLHILTHHCSQA